MYQRSPNDKKGEFKMSDYENMNTPEVQRLAKQGDNDAMYEMAWRLELLPTEEDNPIGRCAWQDYWFEKAADAGTLMPKAATPVHW
jgi:hypothetical protein